MFKRVFRLTDKGTKNLKSSILFCILANLTQFFPFMILMQVMQVIIDPLVQGTAVDTARLWLLFRFGVLAALIYAVCYNIEYDNTYTTAYSECTDIRVEVAEHMRKLPLSFFNRKDLSELTTNIMGDCNTIEQMISHTIPQLIASSVTSTLVCIMLAFYDWRMALALFCVLPISLALVTVSKRVQNKLGERHVQAKLNVSDQVQEYLDGMKVVKAFGLSGEKSESLEHALRQMMKEAIVFEATAGSFATLASMVLQVGVGIVILVGVNLLTAGRIEVIPFFTFVMISTKIFAPITTVLTMLPEIMYFLVSTKRMQSLRTEPAMTGKTDVNINSFDVELSNVTFAYNQDAVIHNMNLTAKQNAVTALVGPSGSGKSTVSRLIARFWDVNQGSIKVGGIDVKTIDPEALMQYMSFVFQDVVLFNDTIMNNIRIGKKDATDEDVYNAARVARCDDFIRNMPDGYNTLIGENGSTLSGGERQRISIARSLLKDAPIVLLDEATASLDPENEVLIQEAISELIKNRTVIVIAHRLKTIAGADQIIVLDDGRLAEQGSHDELLEKGGLYAKLWNIQQESLGWSVSR